MEMEIDYAVHYAFLGLPSGASKVEIKKAYKSKSLLVHPDKNLNDPNAHANFDKLKKSCEILMEKIDKEAREQFGNSVRVKRATLSKRRKTISKMMSDLEERERAAYECDPGLKAKFEEEKITRKLQEDINRIRAQFTKNGPDDVPASKKNGTSGGVQASNLGKGTTLDREKVLKVSWEKAGVDYGVERLKDIFSKFGIVEEVNSKKKGYAVVVMATRDAAVAAIGNVLGDISNPLLVLPLQPSQSTVFPLFPGAPRNVEPSDSNPSNLGHQAFENSVLEKMKKAAKKQR